MTPNNISTWLRFAVQQMAAESYLDQLLTGRQLNEILSDGNNDVRRILSEQFTGKTRFTDQLTAYLVSTPQSPARYNIIDHHANDASGFSATLLFDMETNSYTLSFRSTEFRSPERGGDEIRDFLGGDLEITTRGFAFGQLMAMEDYYQLLKSNGKLPAGAVLNVTGYSLAGHLANVFTAVHREEVAQTYIFNGAGRGRLEGFNGVDESTLTAEEGRIAQMLARFREVLFDPDTGLAAPETPDEQPPPAYQAAKNAQLAYEQAGLTFDPFRQGNPDTLYDDPRYQWAKAVVTGEFPTDGVALAPRVETSNGAYAKVTQVYGRAANGDFEVVANSGLHASAQAILIEDQPEIEGLPFIQEQGSFGNTHALILLVDSLALQELMHAIDPRRTELELERVIKAASNEDASPLAATNVPNVVESNSLENTLDAFRKLFLDLPLSPATLPVDSRAGGYGNLDNRNRFYDELARVRDNATQAQADGTTFTLIDLTPFSASAIAGAAETDALHGIAYRYALKALDPFVLLGAAPVQTDQLYARHNPDAALDLFNEANGTGTLTSRYLEDRALFLTEKFVLNLSDLEKSHGTIQFEDVASNYKIRTTALFDIDNQQFIFDSDDSHTLRGEAMADHLFGGGGHDVLQGQAGEDYLEGGQGNDILSGGIDNDLLEGGAGFDTYIYNTGEGTDRIEDPFGTNAVIFDQQLLSAGIHEIGDLQNTFTSPDGSVTYVLFGGDLIVNGSLILNENFQDGDFGIRLVTEAAPTANGFPEFTDTRGDSDDTVALFGNTNYTVFGNGGNDFIRTSRGNDQLFGGTGNDELYGFSADDRLFGESGDDFLSGDNDAFDVTQGNDYLNGGDGADTLNGGLGNDLLFGGVGNDTLYGDTTGRAQGADTADDYLDGGAGDDELHGLAGDDVLFGDVGNDFLSGEEGNDVADGGTGDDLILTYIGNDTLVGGAGFDRLYGDEGGDVLDGGPDTDELYGGDGADVLYGGAGNDALQGDGLNNPFQASMAGGNDVLDGGDGDDSLAGGGEADVLHGGQDVDHLFGGDGDDQLYGDEGADTLMGDAGNDLLDGGAGNDRLIGGTGADHFMFTAGGGSDTVEDGSDEDSVEAANFLSDEVAVTRSGNDLLLSVTGGSDQLTLKGFFFTPANQIDHVCFADGVTLDTAALIEQSRIITGTEGADVLRGFDNSDDILRGLDGDDQLEGFSGDDQLDGGSGNDQLYGYDGDDVLDGGPGTDELDGSTGNDTYVFGRGSGHDAVRESDFFGGDVDRVQMAPDVRPDDVTIQGVRLDESFTRDLSVTIGGTDGELRVVGFFDDPSSRIEQIAFADGTVWDEAAILSRFEAEGFHITTSSDDGVHLLGTQFRDVMTGGAGNDSLVGFQGADVLKGEGGNDSLIGYEDNDALFGGPGNDELFGDEGTDQMIGGVGDDLYQVDNLGDVIVELPGEGRDVVQVEGLSTYILPAQFEDLQLSGFGHELVGIGNDVDNELRGNGFDNTLEGRGGNDRLWGGAGTDQLRGEAGDDTYHFEAFNGTATIHDLSVSGEGNRLQFGFGIRPSDLTFLRNADTLDITVLSTGDHVVLAESDPANVNGSMVVQTVEFVGSLDQIVPDFQVPLAALLDPVVATEGEDSLTGTAAIDVILGGNGADRLAGGGGNDVLSGGFGNDTYMFNVGDGYDLIDDTGEPDQANTVIFGFGIDPQAIRLEYAGHGGALALKMGTEGLLLMGFNEFDPTVPHPVETFQFADGTTLSFNDLLARGVDVRGTSMTPFGGIEFLSGTYVSDRMLGLDGADELGAGEGDDTLIGGRGNDVLRGGAGKDTYIFRLGDGADEIKDSAEFVSDASDPEGHLVLQDNVLEFGPGITLSDLTLVEVTLTIRTILVGDNGDAVKLPNRVDATPGLQTLVFADGLTVNVYELFDAGLITDDQIINGGPDDDTLLGGAGDDTIVGAAATVSMLGGAGNDTLTGGAGMNRFYGGRGNDRLAAGSGGNTFVFSRGDGRDRISFPVTRLPGTNGVEFQGGYDAYRPTSGLGSLVIRYGDAGDEIHIEGFDPNDAYRNFGLDRIDFTDRTFTYEQWIDLGFDLTGTSGDETITGTNVTDRLMGLDGDDTLDGGVGEDTLTGGRGDDLLLGGAGDDTYVFNLGDGVDTIRDEAGPGAGNRLQFGPGITLPSLTLTQTPHVLSIGVGTGGDAIRLEAFDPSHINGSRVVEIVEFADGSAIHLTSLLLGATDGEDTLLGGPGDDVIEGLGGDDVIDGREDDDTLSGGAGDDIVIGGGGRNTMAGGPGDDTFVVIDTGDVVIESEGEGLDTVQSVISYSLPANVEHLMLVGPWVIDGTGNALDNVLTGNAKANTLEGGAGADTLVGRGGNDTYLFARGDGQDTIVDHDPTGGYVDAARFTSDVTPLDLILSRTANDLRIALYGSGDKLTIQDWYSDPADQIEVFQAGNGQQLLNDQVDQLIQAMAGFSAQSGLTWEQGIEQRPQDVQAVLAGSWQ